VKKWLNDTSISINSKVNIIYPLVWRGENKEFVEIIENLYSKFPEGYNKENFNYLMLDIYEMSGDIDKYKEFANTIINSPNPRIWQIENIARFLKDRNLNAEALMAYDRVLEKMDDNNPRKFDILNRQAEIYIKTGNSQAAIECAKQSAAARPDDPGINSLLASAYRAAGDYKKALEEYCKGVKKTGNGYCKKFAANKSRKL
jgi:tetratricopeptide (TPR) repeat protein